MVKSGIEETGAPVGTPNGSSATEEPEDEHRGGTDKRASLGRAIASRSGSVADMVVRRWEQRQKHSSVLADPEDTERVRQDIIRTTKLATEVVAEFLITGQMPTSEQEQSLYSPGKAPLRKTVALADLTKLYLNWRDCTMEVARDEGARLGSEAGIVREALAVIRAGADGALIRVARQFDSEHQHVLDELAAERARLAHLAMHDPLTGLPNRALLLDRLGHALDASSRRGQLAVLFIDLDHFKDVNDHGGHSAGDQLLIAVAMRLTDVVRPTDTVARMGGDEFVVLCESLRKGTSEAMAVANRIAEKLAEPHVVDGREVIATGSIGVVVASADAGPELVLSQADDAMYRAKQHGRARCELFKAHVADPDVADPDVADPAVDDPVTSRAHRNDLDLERPFQASEPSASQGSAAVGSGPPSTGTGSPAGPTGLSRPLDSSKDPAQTMIEGTDRRT